MAPYAARGSLNIMFQLAITVGILAAQVGAGGSPFAVSAGGWQSALPGLAWPSLPCLAFPFCARRHSLVGHPAVSEFPQTEGLRRPLRSLCHQNPAQLINYGTQHLRPHGWRVSLACGAVPALMLTIGAALLPDTPNSLVLRGKKEEGRKVLQRIRGTGEGGPVAWGNRGALQPGTALVNPLDLSAA
jgi:hypothetical protein